MSVSLVSRRALAIADQRMRESPVVALLGPRSVGKSTLMRDLAKRHNAKIIDLDQGVTRANVAADPGLFVAGDPPIFIDEYQKVPSVLDAIKAELNVDSRPGRFVLTGSTRFDSLPATAQSLTGRILFVPILPFSQGELAGNAENFLEIALAEPTQLLRGLGFAIARQEYAERICAGGMPAVMAALPKVRSRWFDTYANLSLQRDAAELSKIRRGIVLPKLFARLAAQTGQMLNVRAAGRDVDLESATADAYVKILEDLFLLQRLPAWGRTLRSRAVKSPKIGGAFVAGYS
jgi:uncharacterized protein